MQLSKANSILLGVLASLFFATTFVLNRLMSMKGGSWIWSSSLRFYWMLPFFFLIVLYRRNLVQVIREIKLNPVQWLIWSTIGFGAFYAPLTFAAAYSPSWLVASTWQFTIVAGLLIAPIINPNQQRPSNNRLLPFIFSGIILLGIAVMQISHVRGLTVSNALKGILPVLIAAFAFPLGNRKMMQLTAGRLDVFQRILGMTICSLPFWILLSSFQIVMHQNLPNSNQLIQTLIVAICSGVIATVLFFSATDASRSNEKKLAVVEATQSLEVVFALIGEVCLLYSPPPDIYATIGIVLVIIGMIFHSLER